MTVVSLKIVLSLKGTSREGKDQEVGKIEILGRRKRKEFLVVDLATATLVEVATRLGMSRIEQQSNTVTKGLGLGSPKVSLEELMTLTLGGLIASCPNLKMIRISLSETRCLLVV